MQITLVNAAATPADFNSPSIPSSPTKGRSCTMLEEREEREVVEEEAIEQEDDDEARNGKGKLREKGDALKCFSAIITLDACLFSRFFFPPEKLSCGERALFGESVGVQIGEGICRVCAHAHVIMCA